MVVYCTLVNYSCIACHVLNSSCRGTTFSVEYINHQSSKSTVAMKSLLEVTASLLPNIVADQGSRSSATLCWVLHKHFSVFILRGAVSSDFAQNGVKRDGNDPLFYTLAALDHWSHMINDMHRVSITCCRLNFLLGACCSNTESLSLCLWAKLNFLWAMGCINWILCMTGSKHQFIQLNIF